MQGRLSYGITLLRGAWEIAKDVETLQELAHLYRLAGQFDEAIENYQRLIEMTSSAALKREAREKIAMLRRAPAPFSDELMARARATEEAKKAFTVGLALAKTKKNEEAIAYLRAALVLDPALPGTYRVLGGVYGRIGDARREKEFLLDYLRQRPDGSISDGVRAKLKPSGVLASVDLQASFPCTIWINGRSMELNTPQESLLLPPGNHTISFVSAPHHIIRNRRVKLAAGERTVVSFEFGVVTFKLKPWARVRAHGKDIGLWDTVGLPVGEYELTLLAHDASRQKTIKVQVQPKQTLTVDKW